jgi:hypothetical protein
MGERFINGSGALRGGITNARLELESRHSGMRHLAQARNPYSLSWLWIPGSRFTRPGMTWSEVYGRPKPLPFGKHL